MKPWIIAAVIAVVLAIGSALVVAPLIEDKWMISAIAASVSLRALLPSLLIGYLVGRFLPVHRSVPLLITCFTTSVLVVIFARMASGLWLWQLGPLVLFPCAICGIPLLFLIVERARRPNQAPEPTR